MKVILILGSIVAVTCGANTETDRGHKVTHKMWFEITIGNTTISERIVIGLFGKVVPMTVENFVILAQRPKGRGFKGSKIHYSNKKEFIGGGRWFLFDNQWEGLSGFDCPLFDDENFTIKHYSAGWISSHSNGRDEHQSRFLITLKKVSWVDNLCVVFGKVISGMYVVRKIARLPTNGTRLAVDVIISDCGAELADPPFFVDKNDAID